MPVSSSSAGTIRGSAEESSNGKKMDNSQLAEPTTK